MGKAFFTVVPISTWWGSDGARRQQNGNANFPNARGISIPTEKVGYLQRTPVCSRKFISNPHMYTISIPTGGTEHFGQMESAPDSLSHLKQLRVNATSPGGGGGGS